MQTPCATTDDNEQGLRQQSTSGFGRMTPVGVLLVAMGIGGCMDDAHMASRNLSKAADNFEIVRRVVFYNGITDSYMLTIEGLCSIKDADRQLEVTCKVEDDKYIKHFLGLSDNVSYIGEQLEGVDVSTFHHRVTFKPQAIVPNIDVEGDVDEMKGLIEDPSVSAP